MITPDEIDRVREELRFWLRRWYSYPLGYVLECIGDIPTHQQAQILKAFEHHNFVAVKSGHGIGKSKLTGWMVNWWLDTRGKRAPITGAAGDQLLDVVWPEVIMTNGRKMKWLSNQYESTVEELRQKKSRELARAILRVARADNNTALQGFHDCMFFIDEASGVRDEIFDVASGALGDPGSFGLLTGNPTELSGYMYEIFHKPTFWYTMSFSSEDSLVENEYSYPYVDPLGNVQMIHVRGRQTKSWLENMRTQYGLESNKYRVRVLGEFSLEGRDPVIDPRWLDRVSVVQPVPGQAKTGKRRMGIDPAWTGDDDTGVVIRDGQTILHIESWHGFDTVESFERAKWIFDEWDCDYVHVDTIGVGAGIYDNFLHTVWKGRMGYPVIKVHASERAPEDKDGSCAKLRDWLWWKSRKFFRSKAVRYSGYSDDPGWKALKGELRAPDYKILPNGAIQVESKDSMKRRGVKSPNIADALNLTFYQDYDLFRESYVKPEQDVKKKKKQAAVGWKGL